MTRCCKERFKWHLWLRNYNEAWMNHRLMGGGDEYPPPDRKPASLSFVPRGQEDCLLWPFLNGTPKPHRSSQHAYRHTAYMNNTSENKATPLNSMQLRFPLRLFSCYWKSPQIPGSFWNINIYTIMSKQLSSTKAWILEQPVFIANKKNNWIYLSQREVIFFPLKNREFWFDFRRTRLGGKQPCATSLAPVSLCPSSPLSLLYISNPLHPGLLCATKVRKSCSLAWHLFKTMWKCIFLSQMPTSDPISSLWNLIIQHGHGMHGRSWWSGRMLCGWSLLISQCVSHAYFLARGNYLMP